MLLPLPMRTSATFVFYFVLLLSAECKSTEIQALYPSLPDDVFESNNPRCNEDSRLYLEHRKNFTLWAFEMWDATAKSTQGVLKGSVYQLGHYWECMQAKAPFPTQYCLARITAHIPPEKTKSDPLGLHRNPYGSVLEKIYDTRDRSKQERHWIRAAWCAPASCSASDLETALNNYLQKNTGALATENVTYSGVVTSDFCMKNDEAKKLDKVDLGFCLLVALLAICVILSTGYDLIYNRLYATCDRGKGTFYRLLTSFSLKQNGSELLKANEGSGPLNIFYGIRTFCMLMIIMDHRFATYTAGPMINTDFLEKEYRSAHFFVVSHGDLFVDSFFTLSGLLVAYGVLKQFEKRFINPAVVIILRYIRLTPLYAFIIFYYSTLFSYAGSGPMWKPMVMSERQDCRKNWYLNLLYLSNYVKDYEMCMPHSWYLPCDFHYFVVGLFICILMSKHKKIGFSLLSVVLLLSIATTFTVVAIYKRDPTLLFYLDFLTAAKKHPEFRATYTKSHTRATPYLIGLFAGYFYFKDLGTNKRFAWMKSRVVVVFSVVLMLTSMVSGIVFYNPYHKYNAYEAGAYAALHRAMWSLGTVGMLICTSYGTLPLLQKFLSWKPFVPLSKLTYGVYLVHFSYQLRNIASAPGPVYLGYFEFVCLWLGDCAIAFCTSLVLYVGIEAPFKNIFKALLSPPREKTPAKKHEEACVCESCSKTHNGQSVPFLMAGAPVAAEELH